MKKRCALLAVSCVTVFIGLPTTTPPIAWRSMHAAGAPSAKPLGVHLARLRSMLLLRFLA